MRYAIVDPTSRTVRITNAAELSDALREPGLKRGEVDHGTIRPGLAIVVHEHSLFVPPASQKYFCLNHRLYGGPAVIYAYDTDGNTIDFPTEMPLAPFVLWMPTQADVEAAMTMGMVVRPQLAIGDKVFWRWPEPPPSDGQLHAMAEEMAKAGTTVVDGDTIITTEDQQ